MKPSVRAGIIATSVILSLWRPRLHVLAEIGVVLLLFEIGLESDLEDLLNAGAEHRTSKRPLAPAALASLASPP